MQRHGSRPGKERDAAADLGYPDTYARARVAEVSRSASEANARSVCESNCYNTRPRGGGSTMLQIATILQALAILFSVAAIVTLSRWAAVAKWLMILASGAAVLGASRSYSPIDSAESETGRSFSHAALVDAVSSRCETSTAGSRAGYTDS